ncbi:MAG: hypothetical protein GY801_02355 [bacterium]|nr:hypothetical protein [bacterium]
METLTGRELAAALQKPFEMEDIEWKAQASGVNGKGFWVLAVPYIKARAIRDRLDDVVGPENWKTERYEAGAAGGLQCGLSIRINGEWITKLDGTWNAPPPTSPKSSRTANTKPPSKTAIKNGPSAGIHPGSLPFAGRTAGRSQNLKPSSRPHKRRNHRPQRKKRRNCAAGSSRPCSRSKSRI